MSIHKIGSKKWLSSRWYCCHKNPYNLKRCSVKMGKVDHILDQFLKSSVNTPLKKPIEKIKEEPLECDSYNLSKEKQDWNLTQHTAPVHEGKKSFKCSVCDFNFSAKQNLSNHIATVHDGKKPFKCSNCDFNCTTKRNLTRHFSSVHECKKSTFLKKEFLE